MLSYLSGAINQMKEIKEKYKHNKHNNFAERINVYFIR